MAYDKNAVHAKSLKAFGGHSSVSDRLKAFLLDLIDNEEALLKAHDGEIGSKALADINAALAHQKASVDEIVAAIVSGKK